MFPMISAMAAVLVAWALLSTLLIGLGLAVARLAGIRRLDMDQLLVAFWMGLAATIAGLQWWHFLFPVTEAIYLLLVPLAWLGFHGRVAEILGLLRGGLNSSPLAVTSIVLAAIWLANLAIGPCNSIDSGMYHLNVIRWTTDYAIVPGLGNLHVRLGSNQSGLLFSALLDTGIGRGRSHHIGNSLLLVNLVVLSICCLERWRCSNRRWTSDLFAGILLVSAIQMANHWISTFNTDPHPALALYIAAWRLLAYWEMRDEPSATRSYELLVVATMLALAVVMKLTALFYVVAASLLLVTLVVGVRRTCDRRHALIGWACAGLLLVAPWLGRGVLLTGYPLYPSTLLAAPVPWRVPSELVDAEREHIRAFARVHEWAFDPMRRASWEGWNWLGRWWSLAERDLLVPAGLVLVAGLLLPLAWRRLSSDARRSLLLLMPALVGIVCWFGTAPDQRFGFFHWWIAAGLMLSLLLSRANIAMRPGWRSSTALAVLLLAMANIKNPYQGTGEDAGFHPLPVARATPLTTDSGLQVWVPREWKLCWDAPLPCTPFFNPLLRLRRSDDLSSGFVLDPPPVRLAGPGHRPHW
ncbi:hypothetical protein Pan216_23200 [Planctomycetes bacterium Pan216]|uniref:DUF8201 domain-containing protein n=1 Tax=Kolteria novifilia TaxID=2527975 RepID=A0A518B386_9BACT|nr:hypothetical protein Pan216_23200 [Planctomycetes bacterium Pan216]